MDLVLRERKITAYLEKLYSEASNKGTDLSGAPCQAPIFPDTLSTSSRPIFLA